MGMPHGLHLGVIPGGQFQDGFGQNYPLYLEPSDVGNSNIARDHNAPLLDERVSLLGDSAVATGPQQQVSLPLFLPLMMRH